MPVVGAGNFPARRRLNVFAIRVPAWGSSVDHVAGADDLLADMYRLVGRASRIGSRRRSGKHDRTVPPGTCPTPRPRMVGRRGNQRDAIRFGDGDDTRGRSARYNDRSMEGYDRPGPAQQHHVVEVNG